MKISVIIPVYQAEKTIEKCLDSLLKNDFFDYEIILINDGSSDGSWLILEKYQKKYSERIRIFNQINQGVAKTRNRGILLAQGEWVMFVDGDDYIKEDYLKTFYTEACKKKADAVFGGYVRTDGQKALFIQSLKLTEWSKYIVMAPWAKIYRRDFLIKNEIKFLDNNIGEDVYFNLQVINFSDRIFTFNYLGYYWFFNPVSVSNTSQKNLKNGLQVEYLLSNCYIKLKERGVLNKKEVEYFFLRYVVWYLLFASRGTNWDIVKQELGKLTNWLSEHFPLFLKNSLLSPFCPAGENWKNRWIVWFFWRVLYQFGGLKLFLKFYRRG